MANPAKPSNNSTESAAAVPSLLAKLGVNPDATAEQSSPPAEAQTAGSQQRDRGQMSEDLLSALHNPDGSPKYERLGGQDDGNSAQAAVHSAHQTAEQSPPGAPTVGGDVWVQLRHAQVRVAPISVTTLSRISAEFVYNAGADRPLLHVMSGDQLNEKGFVEYCATHYGPVALIDREGKIDKAESGEVWLSLRGLGKRVVRRVLMRPTPEPEDLYAEEFNLWYLHRGNIVKPDMSFTADDVAWYTRTVLDVICGGDHEAFKNHLYRLACQVQRPWQRINSYDYLVGPEGSGKTAVAHDVRKAIFGESLVTLCTGRELVKQFDDALANGLFVIFDELKPSQGREIGETLRNLVTASSCVVELKGKAARKVTGRVLHISVCSNYEDALPLNDGDRRANVMRSTRMMTDEERLWFFGNLSNPESVAKLVGFLHSVDLSKFDPLAPVPLTGSKQAVITACRGDLLEDIKQMFEDRVPPFDRDIIKADDAATSIRIRFHMKTEMLSARKLITHLRVITGEKALATDSIRVCRPGAREGKNERLLVIRNASQWEKATPEERGQHLGPDYGLPAAPPRPFKEQSEGVESATAAGEEVGS